MPIGFGQVPVDQARSRRLLRGLDEDGIDKIGAQELAGLMARVAIAVVSIVPARSFLLWAGCVPNGPEALSIWLLEIGSAPQSGHPRNLPDQRWRFAERNGLR